MPLTLQWHVTERCNLRCAHCYQESYAGEELPLAELLDLVEQFRALLSTWRQERFPSPGRGRVTVTGGEPFVRPDLRIVLETLARRRDELDFAILTNGTLVDDGIVRWLAPLRPQLVQVSLEGGRETNDRIRGAGSFDRTVEALTRLGRAGIPTVISFTAHRANYREFGEVARLGVRLGVTRVWGDRMVPQGSGASQGDALLDPQETRAFFEVMRRARAEACRSFGRTEIAMRRALQFLVGGDEPYRCAAGDTLITLLADGTVYPCRRMPVPVGNVREDSLGAIYRTNELLRTLRDRERLPAACSGCRHARRCGGGLRCLSYGVTGDPFTADPGCWHASRSRAVC